MSRSGFSDYGGDCEDENLAIGRWIAWRNKAFNGKRGQSFLRDLRDTLEAMPEKELIANDLIKEGSVCAIGAVGRARGIDMSKIDPEDTEAVAQIFNISQTLAREIVFVNDDDFRQYGEWRTNPGGEWVVSRNLTYVPETSEQRYTRVLDWVRSQIKEITA